MSASPEQKTDESVKSQAVKWLFGQEANTVALYVIIAALGFGAWQGVPLIWKTQNEFYEKMDDKHEKSRAVDRETYKDAIDRIERRAAARAAFNALPPIVAHAEPMPREDECK